MSNFLYQFNDKINSEETELISDGLDEHKALSGLDHDNDANVFCYDGKRFIGGITSRITGPYLHINLIWVDKNYRNKKIATNLMTQLETYAKEHKCVVSHVNTVTYQAPEFYQKAGYTEIARIKDYYAGQDRIFYRKELI